MSLPRHGKEDIFHSKQDLTLEHGHSVRKAQGSASKLIPPPSEAVPCPTAGPGASQALRFRWPSWQITCIWVIMTSGQVCISQTPKFSMFVKCWALDVSHRSRPGHWQRVIPWDGVGGKLLQIVSGCLQMKRCFS